jgi:hypothetical protein
MADLGELRGDEEGKVGDGPDGSWMVGNVYCVGTQ